ncbi:ComF family protein [Tellurirhabdus bombi]|uniref:ComF family protein n=1 Tax=Tellurirhabdus bombi TaxID=2907205 RepID=UPI001F48FBDB|nr:ComF family protein [Tellurirhabdus bombi]
MTLSPIRRVWQHFLDLLFPQLCLLCKDGLQAGEPLVCTNCRLSLPETGEHRQAINSKLTLFAGKVPIQFVYSFLFFTKKGKVQQLIHALKYRGEKEVGLLMGNWYGHQLREARMLQHDIDLIIGVPLHPTRLRQRGYNQSDWFAKGLSEMLGISWSYNTLIRNRYTLSQTGMNRISRWENVSQVFSVKDKARVQNKRILLVDDVLTTGATLEACATALLAAGAQSIGIITIAATR